MSISNADVQRAIDAANSRAAQGYFGRVHAGDQKAASLFVRLIADDLNPSGKTSDYGWLSKSPGESQVDGYAEDAICFGADPSDLQNVVDMVNGAGAPGATIGGGVKERRPNNKWVAPKPLTAAELDYLVAGGMPMPVPPPSHILPKGDALQLLAKIDEYYAAQVGLQRQVTSADGTLTVRGMIIEGHVDREAVAQWFYQGVIEGMTFDQIVQQIRHSAEWQAKHPGETP